MCSVSADREVDDCSSAGSESWRRKTLAMMKLLNGAHCLFQRRSLSQSLRLMLLIVRGSLTVRNIKAGTSDQTESA